MTSRSPELHRASAQKAHQQLAVLGPIAAYIAFVMELTLVPLLLPKIQLQLELTIVALAWVFNAYGIAVALGVLLAGWLGDAFRIERVFASGVVLFAAGSLLVAAAETFETLIIGRILQGFGGGIFSPLVPILLTRASPEKPGEALIFWGSIAGYIAAFAPLFYSSVLGRYDWQIAFIMIAIVVLPSVSTLRGGARAKTPAQISRRHAKYSTLLRSRYLWRVFAYIFCTYGSITYYLFALPIWLSADRSSLTFAGVVLSAFWLTFSVLSMLLRKVVDGPSLRVVMISAPILILLGFLLFGLRECSPLIVISAFLVGAGLACSNAPSTQLVLRLAPNGMKAASTSLDITFARLGGIVAVAALAETEFLVATLAISSLCTVAGYCALSVSGNSQVET